MSQDILHVDYESFSRADLKECGSHRYAEDASTDFTCVAYAANDAPMHLWCPWESVPQEALRRIAEKAGNRLQKISVGIDAPDVFKRALADKRIKKGAHNAQFERVLTRGNAGKLHGLPVVDIESCVCTMARSAVYGLPHGLDGASKAIGSFPKREHGINEMRYFSKPRKDGSRPTPTEEPDRFVQLALYNIDDVEAERDLDRKVPAISSLEESIYFLDQRINDRGVLCDLESVANMKFLVDEYKRRLAEFCNKVTGLNPTQTAKLSEWIRTNGYPQLPDLQAPTVIECIDDARCPENVKEVLRCYSTFAMKAVSKFESMPLVACNDGRLRGLFKFYGAGPGRWSSHLIQLHNLLRPVISDADVAIELARLRSLESFITMYHPLDPMRVFASCTRGMLMAPKGRDFISFDFSQIEARIRCWLAGQEDLLAMFRKYDAANKKAPLYEKQGSKMFGIHESLVVDRGVMQYRTAAKIGDLACGFQGWEAAVSKMARQQGIKLAMHPAEIASRWRDANPLVVRLWRNLNGAAAMAVAKPGTAWAIPSKRIMFKVEGRWLYMRLPSGRKIAYLDPEVRGAVTAPGERSDAYEVAPEVTYMGVHTETRQWMRCDTYGGKLLQNGTEGIGRDFLTAGLLRMEAGGYETVATVHDQGLFEVDEGFGSLETAEKLMAPGEPWAADFPVKADGWRKKRFRK